MIRPGISLQSMKAVLTLVAAILALCVVHGGSLASAHQALPTATSPGIYPYGVYDTGERDLQWFFESKFPGDNNKPSKSKEAVRRAALQWWSVGRDFQFRVSADPALGYREEPWLPGYAAARRETTHPNDDQPTDSTGGTYCGMQHDDIMTPDYDPRPTSLVFWTDLNLVRSSGNEAVAEATNCVRYESQPGTAVLRYKTEKFLMGFDSGRKWYRGTKRPPAGQYDLAGVAAHEFGHATGWIYHFDQAPKEVPLDGAKCGAVVDRETMCTYPTLTRRWDRTLGTHDKETFSNAYPPR
jgi:hypothetical protein